jgi:hypothetical protein
MKPTDTNSKKHPLGSFYPLENLEYHPIIWPNGQMKLTDILKLNAQTSYSKQIVTGKVRIPDNLNN